MNNLKRVLSLGLSGTMLAGMMITGASAANKDFTDASEITHTEAVNTMAALNVINGKDTGAFDPKGTVTRAEMAKMITVALNGGNAPTLGTSTTPLYSDIGGHWAQSYIEYCSNLKIIAGQGDGTFNPDGSVTGAQAAKMLLVALGYDTDVFKFTGIDWEINVNIQANDAKLYDELKGMDTSAALSRDSAAQMIYNALDSYIMEKSYDKVASDGSVTYKYAKSTTTTFLNDKFDAYTWIGTYVGNYDTGAASNKGEIAVSGKLDTAADSVSNRTAKFPSELDISNIGEEVKVIFKDGKSGTDMTPDKNDTIYGAFNTGKTEVYNVTKNDIQDADSATKVKFDDTKYDLADSVEVITNYITDSPVTYTSGRTLQTAIKTQSVDAIKFVTNSDGKIDRAYITNYYVGKVSGISSSKVTISGVGGIDIDDNNIADGLKVDDVVVYTKFFSTNKDDATYTVAKAESVEGELTGYKIDTYSEVSNCFINVVVDNTTYKVNVPATSLANLTDDAITQPGTDGDIDDTVRVYLVNGMVAAIQSIEQNGGKYALVTETSTTGTVGSDMEPLKVTLLLNDGTKQTVSVHKDSTYDADNGYKISSGTDAVVDGSSDQLARIPAKSLIEYSSISDGKVKVKNVATAATAINATDGSPAVAQVWNKTTKTLVYTGSTGAVATTDAVAFVYSTANTDYYAYSLRGLGNISNTDTTGVKVSYFLKDNGQIAATYMELAAKPGSSTADTLYGIVSGYQGTRKLGDDTYYQYSVAVGRDEALTVYVSTNALTKGELVSFDETSDSKYDSSDFTNITSSLAAAGVSTYTVGAVKEYGDNILSYYTSTSRADANSAYVGAGTSSVTVDKDVKIIYVNYDDPSAGDQVGVSAFDASTGYANVIFHTDSDGVVDMILVESSGDKSFDATNFGTTTTYTVNTPAAVTASTPKGAYTATVATSPAEGGTTVTVTVTCGTLPDSGTDTITITGTGISNIGTSLTVASTGSIGVVGTITFTMPSAAVSDLALSVTNG